MNRLLPNALTALPTLTAPLTKLAPLLTMRWLPALMVMNVPLVVTFTNPAPILTAPDRQTEPGSLTTRVLLLLKVPSVTVLLNPCPPLTTEKTFPWPETPTCRLPAFVKTEPAPVTVTVLLLHG